MDPSYLLSGLTKEEVLAQAILFFLAGYDTTATTIAFCIYNLTVNPEYQDKLYEEIERVVGDKVLSLTPFFQNVVSIILCL